MSKRHPDRPNGQMGRPPIVVRVSGKLAGWTPRRVGRPTKRLQYLFRRVDQAYERAEVALPVAIVTCPACPSRFQLFDSGNRTPRAYMRSKIMDHAKRQHSWMTIRAQSLLADRAVEAAEL